MSTPRLGQFTERLGCGAVCSSVHVRAAPGLSARERGGPRPWDRGLWLVDTLTHTHTEIHICTHTHIQIHAHAHSHSSTNTFTYVHTHLLTCKHTRTQTHAHTLAHSCTRSFNSSPHALILLASVPLQPFSSDITPVPSLWVSPDRSRALGAGQGVVSVGLSLGGTHGSQVFRVNPKARTMSELRGEPCAGHMGMSVSWPP